MNSSQNIKFKDWADFWTSFNNFLLTLKKSDREYISKLLEEARLHVNGMTDGWFEFTEIFETAIIDNKTDLTANEMQMAKELLDYIKIPLTKK